MKAKTKVVNGVSLVVVDSKTFKGVTNSVNFTITKEAGSTFSVNVFAKEDSSRKLKNFMSYSLEGAVDVAKAC